MKKQTKTKIGVGSFVKANVGELENITREGGSRSMRKEVVGCVQSVVGKKKFLLQFEDEQKKGISSSSLVFLISKEEVDMDEPILHLPEKEEGELLTIMGILRLENLACLENLCICLCFIVCVILRIDLHICWRNRWCKREIRT